MSTTRIPAPSNSPSRSTTTSRDNDEPQHDDDDKPQLDDGVMSGERSWTRIAHTQHPLDALTEELIKPQQDESFDPDAIQLQRPIGYGGQGIVWLADNTDHSMKYAVKQVYKGRLAGLPHKALMRVFTEKKALTECRHPFVTQLFGTFQDATFLYFCLELGSGVDLFTMMGMLPGSCYSMCEEQACFYTATVALALRHIHSCGYMYRDMKLENVLIDSKGYAKLCDFGFAKSIADSDSQRSYTLCGTDEYVPPEAIAGLGRSTAADWWGLGVLLHELLTGHPPFQGRWGQDLFNVTEKYAGGGTKAAELLLHTAKCYAHGLSSAAGTFLIGLLRANEAERIGCGPEGFLAIENDPWFISVSWTQLLNKEMPAPWLPPQSIDSASTLSAKIPEVEVPEEYERMHAMKHAAFAELEKPGWAPIFDDFGPMLPMELRQSPIPAEVTPCSHGEDGRECQPHPGMSSSSAAFAVLRSKIFTPTTFIKPIVDSTSPASPDSNGPGSPRTVHVRPCTATPEKHATSPGSGFLGASTVRQSWRRLQRPPPKTGTGKSSSPRKSSSSRKSSSPCSRPVTPCKSNAPRKPSKGV